MRFAIVIRKKRTEREREREMQANSISLFEGPRENSFCVRGQEAEEFGVKQGEKREGER